MYNYNRYLYQLSLAIDANFRLKRKERGIQDKSLSDGLAYVVQADPYTNFLDAVSDFNEVGIFPLNNSQISLIFSGIVLLSDEFL